MKWLLSPQRRSHSALGSSPALPHELCANPTNSSRIWTFQTKRPVSNSCHSYLSSLKGHAGWPLLPFYVLLLMHKKEKNKIFFELLFSLISPFLWDDFGIFHNYEMQYFLKLSLNTMSGFDHLIYDRCYHALILAYWSGKWFFECEPSFLC